MKVIVFGATGKIGSAVLKLGTECKGKLCTFVYKMAILLTQSGLLNMQYKTRHRNWLKLC